MRKSNFRKCPRIFIHKRMSCNVSLYIPNFNELNKFINKTRCSSVFSKPLPSKFVSKTPISPKNSLLRTQKINRSDNPLEDIKLKNVIKNTVNKYNILNRKQREDLFNYKRKCYSKNKHMVMLKGDINYIKKCDLLFNENIRVAISRRSKLFSGNINSNS